MLREKWLLGTHSDKYKKKIYFSKTEVSWLMLIDYNELNELTTTNYFDDF